MKRTGIVGLGAKQDNISPVSNNWGREPKLDTVALGRLQFTATGAFHFIFVPLTLGLSVLTAYMETRYAKGGGEVYLKMTKFWGKLFISRGGRDWRRAGVSSPRRPRGVAGSGAFSVSGCARAALSDLDAQARLAGPGRRASGACPPGCRR